jgi:hypothetical protein
MVLKGQDRDSPRRESDKCLPTNQAVTEGALSEPGEALLRNLSGYLGHKWDGTRVRFLSYNNTITHRFNALNKIFLLPLSVFFSASENTVSSYGTL